MRPCEQFRKLLLIQTDGHFFVRLSVRNFFFFFDGQTDGRKNVCLSGILFIFWRTDRRTKKCPSVCPEFFFFFDGQTDGNFFVRVSARKFIYFLTDRRTKKCPSVCPEFFFFWRTDRRTKKCPSVCPEFFFFLTDRQTDEKMSVCLSGIFFFFWRTDRRTKKCPSVCPEFFFFFDGQTDGQKNVRLSVRNFFFFFWRTDRRTKKCPSVCPEFIFFFFFDGQTDGRKNVRLSVRNFFFFFFLTDRQTDEKCPSAPLGTHNYSKCINYWPEILSIIEYRIILFWLCSYFVSDWGTWFLRSFTKQSGVWCTIRSLEFCHSSGEML